ncbi:DUF6355 family natural product biosynthesis protein [Amycolatopsis sp. lyj-109]|uniref:DUF6355 family natural product biosynthesis protein n=1 Tax=Amycolatopsis sp. lyj-109 TaxID=2789287 RepID=UPI00397BAD5F
MSKSGRSRSLTIFTFIVTLGAALFAGGPAATAATTHPGSSAIQPAQFTCGYHTINGWPYYGHCDAPPRTDIVINVYNFLEGDRTMCVKPGLTRLKQFDTYAAYAGRLCSA